ncbi:MAG: hypothetical protein NT072_02660 [Deltaproteobacteria bacterium]|nr:hypothetical protein [Deltaproteobacteria bacterium]
MKSSNGIIEKRQCDRTNVTLRGRYILSKNDDVTENKDADDAYDITIMNMSKYGIGFILITPMEVNVNDVLRVKFVVESEQRVMVVEEDMVVKWTKGNFGGAEFITPIDDYVF